MMSETAIETAVCSACGADVRNESLFCYNCGERVKETLADIETPSADTEKAVRPGSRPPLRTAASLRKQRRAYNRQPVEISWEPPAGSPAGFVITTIVLAVGALVLLLLALYLR